MFKSSIILSAAAALFVALLFVVPSAVYGCDIACTAVRDDGGKCYYSCSEGTCHMTANHHRDMFLNGLADHGYNCQPIGVSALSCVKDANFGSCYQHRWTCGDC